MTETAVSFNLSIFRPMGSRWKTSPHPSQAAPSPEGRRPTRDDLTGQAGRGGCSTVALLMERSPKLLGCEGREATRPRPRCSPGSLARYPPTLPAPHPCTSSWLLSPSHSLKPSSSETASEAGYASFAEVARRMLAGRALRSPRAAAAERRRALSSRPGFALQRLSQRGWRGRRKQTGRAAPPRRHSADPEAARTNASPRRHRAPPPRRGGAGVGVLLDTDPGTNNHQGPYHPKELILGSGTGLGPLEGERALWVDRAARALRASMKG